MYVYCPLAIKELLNPLLKRQHQGFALNEYNRVLAEKPRISRLKMFPFATLIF